MTETPGNVHHRNPRVRAWMESDLYADLTGHRRTTRRGERYTRWLAGHGHFINREHLYAALAGGLIVVALHALAWAVLT